MDLLFRRNQTAGRFRRVQFSLWAKTEPSEEEHELLERYRMRDAILIETAQEGFLKNLVILWLALSVILSIVVRIQIGSLPFSVFLTIVFTSGAFFFWIYHEFRETIYVKDLLHGRTFTCPSVVALLKKEAQLHSASTYLRQVIESAKHWDGTEHVTIEPLPKERAWKMVRRG